MKVNIVTNISRGWDWSYSRMAIAIQQRVSNIDISSSPLPNYFDIVHFIPGDPTLIQNVKAKKVAWLGNFYMWNNKLKNVIDSVDFVVFQQNQLMQDAIKMGIDKNKVANIRPGTDLDKFKIMIKIGIAGQVRVLRNRDKGGPDLTQLFMRSKWENFKFIFAGRDWDKEFGNTYKELGVNIEFLGNVPYQDMPNFYNSIDYFLVPARIEPGPLVFTEALACGRPVISTRAGRMSEFDVIHYETIDELADILRDTEKNFLLRRLQVEGLTWDNWAEKHREIYRGLCANL